ncbi:hypothetical protein I3760_11G081800 [Carya illinoinensis]|nr:hypothetical protein I3760_11G081800 [Carya illinoinensis]
MKTCTAFPLLLITFSLLKVAASEEGFCSSPYSVVNSDTDSNTLYWKVTNPTLSPPYLRGQY